MGRKVILREGKVAWTATITATTTSAMTTD